MRHCEVRKLGVVTYENGMQMQETLVEMRQRDEIPDQLLLLEHTPVITLGRAGDQSNLLATADLLKSTGVRFYPTTRGGDITYHGPGQLVGYPIIHLGEGRRDIRKYVQNLEEVLIRTVADFGIEAKRSDLNRGIWVGHEKLAAIGVRVGRWVTSHGFALNVSTNMSHFALITPCGIRGAGVTSIERLTGRKVPLSEVGDRVTVHFAEIFEREMIEPSAAPMQVVKVVVHDGDRVLLLKRHESAGGFWQPVTGGIETNESPADAGRRELFEETGQTAGVESIELHQSFLIEPKYTPERAPLFADEYAFSARVNSAAELELDAEEHSEARWFTFEEAYGAIKWSDDREALERVEKALRQE